MGISYAAAAPSYSGETGLRWVTDESGRVLVSGERAGSITERIEVGER